MKETPNSWTIQLDPYDRSQNRREQEKKSRGISVFNVRLCPDCNRVHEMYYTGSIHITTYYESFPKYKLERTSCVECDGE